MRYLIAPLAAALLMASADAQSLVEPSTVPSETPQRLIPVGPQAPPRSVSEAEQRLIGAWAGDGHTLHIGRMPMDDLPSGLYVELARDEAPHHPIWQQVWILRQIRGEDHARVFLFSDSTEIEEFYKGAWAAPGRWTPPSSAALAPLGDLRLSPAGDTLRFAAAEPFPAARADVWSVDMEVTVGPSALTWKAAGLDEDGEPIWGDQTLEMRRLDEPRFPVTVRDDGLVFIDYRSGEGPRVATGDSVFLDFAGYLPSGRQIDRPSASRRRSLEVPGPMPTGVNEALLGLQQGSIRRVLIPPELGAAMDRRGVVPADAQLVYHLRIYSMFDKTPE